ncbi:MAG: hypothetical protein CVV64_11640 [Candidatus Wallbacteria bacterium HGW-Wallbacteria-1]|uniref:Uncharacterized protein n=1 Tax=Candidatus Wallbacteria bacterium HGW-Wallbacteria-1 TaxID=2013854 RepID=A0A2N1PNQ2_9BACT|nr:MAG: hypothetical protein CVV64_11640 [Candidatus Wallbacteria bacterium HGW-Wallbacteria-1]
MERVSTGDRMIENKTQCLMNCPPGLCLIQNSGRGLILGLAGLGNVGGTAAAALRMMPVSTSGISALLLYDKDPMIRERWRLELEAIRTPWRDSHPEIHVSERPEELFQSDIFAFAVSLGVPEPGDDSDVRGRQFKNNARVLTEYASMAKSEKFDGVIGVISDPVEHLCAVMQELMELPSGRIVGLGLGVMFARAVAIAREVSMSEGNFHENGIVYGSHGAEILFLSGPTREKGFDPELSKKVSELTATRNLDIRKTGFKPYIGPALSSAALSISAIATGKPFFGSILSGDIFFGGPLRSRFSASSLGSKIEIFRENIQLCDEAEKMVALSRMALREDFCRRGTLLVKGEAECG